MEIRASESSRMIECFHAFLTKCDERKVSRAHKNRCYLFSTRSPRFIENTNLSGSRVLLSSCKINKKTEYRKKRHVKTRYRSYDFIVDDCPQLRVGCSYHPEGREKKWNATNYTLITLISEIILSVIRGDYF